MTEIDESMKTKGAVFDLDRRCSATLEFTITKITNKQGADFILSRYNSTAPPAG